MKTNPSPSPPAAPTPEICSDCVYPFTAGYHMPGEPCPVFAQKITPAPAAPCPSSAWMPSPSGVTGESLAVPAPVSPSLPAHPKPPFDYVEGKTLIHIETRHDNPNGAGVAVCSIPKAKAALAGFIVTSCNSNATLKADVERLTGALRDTLQAAETLWKIANNRKDIPQNDTFDAARAALSLAEVGKH